MHRTANLRYSLHSKRGNDAVSRLTRISSRRIASREFFFAAISLRRKRSREFASRAASPRSPMYLLLLYLNLNGTTWVFISQELCASGRFLKWRNTMCFETHRFDEKRSFRFICIHFVLSTTLFRRNTVSKAGSGSLFSELMVNYPLTLVKSLEIRTYMYVTCAHRYPV